MKMTEANRVVSARGARGLFVALLICLLAAGGMALAATGGAVSSHRASGTDAVAAPSLVPPEPRQAVEGSSDTSSGPTESTSAPERVDTEAFSVLRRPRTAADDLPATVHVAFSANAGAEVGLARRVQNAAGTAYVIPGKGSMCLMSGASTEGESGAGGAGCVANAEATQGYLEMEEGGEYNSNEAATATTFVSGLVPDGVNHVTLHLSGGRIVVAPVSENVYMREVRGRVSEVTFLGPRGGMTTVGRHG